MRLHLSWLLSFMSVLCFSCTNPFEETSDGGTSDAKFVDGAEIKICKDTKGDQDGDGIPNGDEGCLQALDSDNDGTPDWQDFDSDDDGISDALEKGEKDAKGMCKSKKPPKNHWPCDSDGDGYPDFRDLDSDGDKVLDKDEDLNGDGLIGCCVTACGKPGIKQEKSCPLTDDGCGKGQTCEKGLCTPAVTFSCSKGETNPLTKDTFGDGKLDKQRGNFICRESAEEKNKGLKLIQTRKNQKGDWHVAFDRTIEYGELKIDGEGEKEAAGTFDDRAPLSEVAGFVLSRDTTHENIQEELTEIIQRLTTQPPGGAGTISVRASGTQGYSHDSFISINGTILDLKLNIASNVSTVRNELLGNMLGKQMAQLENLPTPFGNSATEYVIRFVTVKRFEFKTEKDPKTGEFEVVKDAKGNPVDSGDKSKWRLLVMGAVAAKDTYQDGTRITGVRVEDLSNGTALARFGDVVFNECDVDRITGLPIADIIWVVDESGSMSDNRDDIVNNANTFFTRAIASGLDFRMAVTGVNSPSGSYKKTVGKFCSRISTNSQDDGGDDRFLTPSEQDVFSACIKNPPGYEGGSEYGLVNSLEAVKLHLPRAANAPEKIRPNAKLVIIYATDEVPQSFSSTLGGSTNFKKCTLDSTIQAAVHQELQPYTDMFSGVTDPEGAAIVHVIGGVCNNSCSADVAHGYRELAQQFGGQIGDVCQKDLGNTLQIIIDSIVAGASPVKLDFIPISASLAVAVDDAEIQRSRKNGFDYHSSANSLVFINVDYKQGSEIIASYKRWRQGSKLE